MRAYGRNIGQPWAAHNEGRADPITGKPPRSAKRDKRVAFVGRELISYHTTVARYHDAPAGGKIVLVSERYAHYSISTSSHINSCTSFVKVPMFEVPYTDPFIVEQHVANFSHLWGKVTDIAAKAAKNWNPERSWHAGYVATTWRDNLTRAYEHACLYAKLCKVPGKRQPLSVLMNLTEDRRIEKLLAYNDPKEVARRARVHARYIAKKALGLK